MNDLNLPEPIAAYFQADSQDGGAVASCFTNDARVRDEGQTHEGIAAIKAWKVGTSSTYFYTTTPIKLEKTGRVHVVTGHVVGNFPGSPVDLRYRFTLERGKISLLEITS